eukprot:3372737-Rhodomonas_salina.1
MSIECIPPRKQTCTNHQLQRSSFVHTTIINTNDRGHGLRTDENIRAGQVIDEYVGKVMTKTRYISRSRLKTLEQPFYYLQLQPGYIIDGEFHGNNTRFINNSCSPN